MKECFTRPHYCKFIKENTDYVMFIDENGCVSQVSVVQKALINKEEISQNDRYFTLTGCIFELIDYKKAISSFTKLKKKYWKDSRFNDKFVCFHSREIRRRENAFGFLGSQYNAFMDDLTSTLKYINCKIISITIDIVEYLKQGKHNNIYSNAFYFLIERYIYATQNYKKGIIILENRGPKEDSELLKQIDLTINFYGTKQIKVDELQNKIKAVFFNPKWKCGYDRTYVGLEIADLFSYPIHKFIRSNVKDKAFSIIESKIDGYPNYINKGIKVFPNKK